MLCCNDSATTEIYTYSHTRSLHDALPSWTGATPWQVVQQALQIPRADGPKYQWRPNAHLLAQDLTDDFQGKALAHPWLDGPPDRLPGKAAHVALPIRSEEHTSELSSLMRLSYAVFCLKNKK